MEHLSQSISLNVIMQYAKEIISCIEINSVLPPCLDKIKTLQTGNSVNFGTIKWT